jgi:hypothetical protein
MSVQATSEGHSQDDIRHAFLEEKNDVELCVRTKLRAPSFVQLGRNADVVSP